MKTDEKVIWIYHQIQDYSFVKEKVPIVIKKIEQLKKLRNYHKHLSMLKSHVEEQKDESARVKILDEIVSFITNDEVYEELEGIFDKDKEQIFRKYKSKIGLEAILPIYSNVETTCVLSFRNIKVRNTILILDNKTVLTQLFSGLFTDPKYGCRSFIETEEENQDILDLDNVIIHIGNSKLKLPQDDIYVLCEVIDVFANKYFEYIKKIEDLLKTHGFPLSKRRNNYKLTSIDWNEWKKLVEFAFEHDVDDGRSRWHIFDRNSYYLKIYTDKQNKNYNRGYHAFFNVEYDEDIVLYPDLTSQDLTVTWELIEVYKKQSVNFFNIRENWDAEIAYNWFVNELKPKVLGKDTIKEERSSKTRFYLKNQKLTSVKDLYDIVLQLQHHYHIHPHNRYRIYRADIAGLYKAIAICLKSSSNPDLHYISSSLHLRECKTITELIDSILELAANIMDITINGFGIDLLFRGLFASLDSDKVKLSYEDIQQIWNNIYYFVDVHDREVILDKYSIEFV